MDIVTKVVLEPWIAHKMYDGVPLFYDESDMSVARCGFVDANINPAAYIDPKELAKAQSINGSFFMSHEYGNCSCWYSSAEEDLEVAVCPECGNVDVITSIFVLYCPECKHQHYFTIPEPYDGIDTLGK